MSTLALIFLVLFILIAAYAAWKRDLVAAVLALGVF